MPNTESVFQPNTAFTKGENPQVLDALVIYCVGTQPPDRDLFFKAIDGLTDDEILRRDDTTTNVVLGLKVFGEKERAERLLKLKKEQAKPKKA